MTDELVINKDSNDVVVVAFGGMAKVFGGVQPFEFLRFFTLHFPTVNQLFYIDSHSIWYHNGIRGISTDIDSTQCYLKQKISKYKKVIFTGVSAGGYASILFGSLLNVDHVIAFSPQTRINPNKKHDKRYMDLKNVINNTTQYSLYANIQCTDKLHHVSHSEHIENFSNVSVHRRNGKNVVELRNSGELYNIFNCVINQ